MPVEPKKQVNMLTHAVDENRISSERLDDLGHVGVVASADLAPAPEAKPAVTRELVMGSGAQGASQRSAALIAFGREKP